MKLSVFTYCYVSIYCQCKYVTIFNFVKTWVSQSEGLGIWEFMKIFGEQLNASEIAAELKKL